MPDSKRKAKYQPSSDRASYSSVLKKGRATTAISRRWNPPEHAPTITGSRIMNMTELSKSIEHLTSHSAKCGGYCMLEGETHVGLATVISARCTNCHQEFKISSSTYTTTSTGAKKWHINIAAVLGQMSTGGGNARLEKVLTTMGVPGMRKQLFRSTEQFLGESMKEQLVQSMAAAGQKERELAISSNNYHQGVPYVSVVADGGWSKRSHKHSYNAKSGVAVIFGLKTKQLLFLGVRNKYCSVCAVAEHKKVSPKQHICYRNWDRSSCAMESDIIVEGFRLSEATHGIRYLKMVADGDSSVMYSIREAVPYGIYVEKIECANHAVKCYRSRLEQLAKDHPEYRGRGGLTKRAIQRLTVGARIAIRLHSKNGDIQQLRKDLRNGPAHVFGDHSSCSSSFCKYVDEATEVPVDDDQSEEEFTQQQEDQEPTTLLGHLNRIAEAETEVEPTPEDELAAQSGYTRSLSELPDGLFRKVMACGDRLVMLAPQLISNLTSNLAECYMGLRAICDGGKQYNRIQSGSFEHRCYAAGLQAQHGPQWGVKFWKGLTGEEPNQVCYCVPLLKYSTISSAIFT